MSVVSLVQRKSRKKVSFQPYRDPLYFNFLLLRAIEKFVQIKQIHLLEVDCRIHRAAPPEESDRTRAIPLPPVHRLRVIQVSLCFFCAVF